MKKEFLDFTNPALTHDKDMAKERFAKKQERKLLDDQKRIHKKMKAHFDKQHAWPLRDESKKGRKV